MLGRPALRWFVCTSVRPCVHPFVWLAPSVTLWPPSWLSAVSISCQALPTHCLKPSQRYSFLGSPGIQDSGRSAQPSLRLSRRTLSHRSSRAGDCRRGPSKESRIVATCVVCAPQKTTSIQSQVHRCANLPVRLPARLPVCLHCCLFDHQENQSSDRTVKISSELIHAKHSHTARPVITENR